MIDSVNKQGKKDDNSKLRFSLLPNDAIEAIVDVLEFGAGKYDDRNWEKGIKYSRIYDALLRHMFAWWQGEDIDSESGKSHLAHAGACVLFLLSYEKRGMDSFDDRNLRLRRANEI